VLWRRRGAGRTADPRGLVELNEGSGNRWNQLISPPALSLSQLAAAVRRLRPRRRRGATRSSRPPADATAATDRTNWLTSSRPRGSSRVPESLLNGRHAGRSGSRCDGQSEREATHGGVGLRRLEPGGRSGLESHFLQRQTTADLEWDQNPSWSEERRAPASMSIGASTQTDTKTFSCKGAHNLYSPMGNTKHKSPYSFSSHQGTYASGHH